MHNKNSKNRLQKREVTSDKELIDLVAYVKKTRNCHNGRKQETRHPDMVAIKGNNRGEHRPPHPG